jgi:hypothetical protein
LEERLLFLGVAVFGLVADCAHYVDLATLFVDCVAHGFAVDCEALIFPAISFIPFLQGSVKVQRIYADKHIAEDVLAWNYTLSIDHSASETFTRLLAETVCPVRYGLITSHSAQNSSSRNGEHGRELVSAPLNTAGIRDIVEKFHQRPHMIGSYRHLSSSNTKGRFQIWATQNLSSIGF